MKSIDPAQGDTQSGDNSSAGNLGRMLVARNHEQWKGFIYWTFRELEYCIYHPLPLYDPALSIKENKAKCPCILPADAPSKRLDGCVGVWYWLLVADIDTGNLSPLEVLALVRGLGLDCRFYIYSSIRSQFCDPDSGEPLGYRWKIMVPLAEPLPPDQWQILQHWLVCLLRSDTCTTRIQQLSYLPARTQYYRAHIERKPLFCPSADHSFVLGAYRYADKVEAQRQADEAAKRERQRERTEKAKQSFVSEEQISPIQHFNETHDWPTILTAYGCTYDPGCKKWKPPSSISGKAGIKVFPKTDKAFCHNENEKALADGHAHSKWDFYLAWEYGDLSPETSRRAAQIYADSTVLPSGLSITAHNREVWRKSNGR